MSYDKNGLGYTETMLCEFYFPSVYETVKEADDTIRLKIMRKTIDAYNLGLIGIELVK